ncbi:hypothetical protein QVD17_16429 [Tagetes erecta]|uniref:Transmembrane protein n=1 Tax=Tagetes erecta TaxID=13708 RepID=A0AAD8KXU8_TARER|nr:hypothetical protein QVD17_16429 [Tagetes erecta]
MADWGPVLVAVVLFVLLTPGLLFQLPGHNRVVEFGSMTTSCAAVIVHAVIFFGVLTLFLITIGVHVYAGTPNSSIAIRRTGANWYVANFDLVQNNPIRGSWHWTVSANQIKPFIESVRLSPLEPSLFEMAALSVDKLQPRLD